MVNQNALNRHILSPEAVTKVQPKCILVKTIAKLAPGKSQPSNSLSAWLANRFVPKLFLNLVRNFTPANSKVFFDFT